MARTVTRLQIQTRIYQRANMENHLAFATNTEVQDVLNEALAEAWDEFVSVSPPDRMSSQATITTVSGTVTYALPADFLSLRAVWVDESNGEYRPIRGVNDQERQAYRPPGGAYNVIVKYLPACALLTSDGTTFDGIDGFEELAVVIGAIKLLFKEGSSSSLQLIDRAVAERERQRARAKRGYQANVGEPERVSRRAYRYTYPFPYTYRLSASTIHAYQLQGSNINLFQFAGATVP